MKLNFEINSESFVKKVFWTLVIIELALVLLDYIFNFSLIVETKQIRRIFNIARETSLPTWFSSLQFLLVGISFALVYKVRKKILWLLFSGFFSFLSMDDASSIHERLGTIYKSMVHAQATETANNMQSYGWQMLIAPIYAIIGVALFIFIWTELKTKARLEFFIGLVIYALAISMDYLEGIDSFFPMIREMTGYTTYTISHYSKTIEEFLEMLGTSIILCSALKTFLDSTKSIHIDIKNKGKA